MQKERVLLTLSGDAKTALRVLAAQNGTTQSALVERWIKEHSAQKETA